MYIQHMHMLCGEFHIYHDLVLDQNVNDNAYSPPLLHDALEMEQKMVILVIGLYHNIFSHICVKHKRYPEHDTLCMSILFHFILSYIYLITNSMFTTLHRKIFLGIVLPD